MKYVVIGASAAGVNGVENLRRLDEKAEIVMISKDKDIYSRCIIHHYISGERTKEGISFVDKDFFEKNNINWIKGASVVSLDEVDKKVILDNGQEVSYDKLLIASGSRPFIPRVENLKNRENVIGLKTLEDCDKIIELAKSAKNIAILGAGLIGVDAVTGLLHSKDVNAKLSLIEGQDRLLPIQLDKEASATYERELEKSGVSLHLGDLLSKVNLTGEKITSLTLESGTQIEADLVIVATGVRSNIEFLEGTSIETNRFGLVFNEKGETNVEDIYGAGDVSGVAPIWSVAVKEAIIATDNMVGQESKMTDFFSAKATMNFFNIPTLALGDSAREDEYYTKDGFKVESMRDEKGNYKKIIHKDGIISGALIQGDLFYTGVLTQLIREKIDISNVKKSIFNIDYSDFYKIKSNQQFTY